LATTGVAFAAAARFAAQRLFVAAIIRFMPSSLILRLGFWGSGMAGASSLDSAHRFRWASVMRFLAAALIGRRFAIGASGVTTGLTGQHGPEVCDLSVDAKLLLFKTFDGGVNDLGSEFVRGHQD
jgi:hypothetical protein